jgi:F-type H+-transporting ATPase subunit epsilon
MTDAVKVEIVSPEKLVLSDTATSVTVPGAEGYFTVMGNHGALMSVLKPGFVTVGGEKGDHRTYYVRGGFAEVTENGLTILAEEARTGADFEIEEVKAAILAAEEELKKAEIPEAKNLAQATLDGWNNLLVDAQHMGPTVQL